MRMHNKRRCPRKIKKAITMVRPWWVNVRLESKYQHIFNPFFSKERSKYSKWCNYWRSLFWINEYGGSIERLADTFGAVDYDMVEDYNYYKNKI